MGTTALMIAAQSGGEHGAEMMRVLVDAGADGNKQTKDAWTAPMIVAQYGGARRGDDARARRRRDGNKQDRTGGR